MDIGRALPADLTRDVLAQVLSYKTLYEALSRTVSDACIEVDSSGRIVRWNVAAEALTGYSAQSAIGTELREFLQDAVLLDDLARLPIDGPATEMRFSLHDHAGKHIDVRGWVSVLRSNDEVEGWLLACVPARRIDEIEQLKNEFVSTVSHELKTPLAAVKAYCSTLISNPSFDEERRAEYLSVIDHESDRLARSIDDLLLVTRVEAGQMLKRRVRLTLDSILSRVVEQLAYDPQRHEVVIQTNGVRISGDPDRIVDVLVHVIDNAIKYTPDGGTIAIDAHEDDGHTVVEVRDSGIGIASDHLPLIFDRFYRVDSDLTSSVGGSGLGLYLVNSLVRAHGGNVGVRSEPGKGSTFTIKLPVRE